MRELLNYIYEFFHPGAELPEFYVDVAWSITVVLVLLVTRWILLSVLFSRTTDIRLRYNWKRFSAHGVGVIGLLAMGLIWIDHFERLLTYFGLVSAGVAIALSDIIKNLAGWFFIAWRRPFSLGDRIEIGPHAGDVIDIRLFQFTLLEIGNWVQADQSTGRIIHIPNGKVFTDHLSNFYRGLTFIWSELQVVITFESDWQKAKQVFQAVLDRESVELTETAEERIRRASQRYMIYYRKLSPIVYTSVVSNGVCLTLRYLTEPRRRRIMDERMWEGVLKAIAKEKKINLAYPTTRFFDHSAEQK